MKLYIAGHNQEEAKSIAKLCCDAGHEITSRWLEEDFSRMPQYTSAERIAIAHRDCEDVHKADALVLIPSSMRVPGGKFVEAGIAIGTGKRVYILGHRENMLMHHPLCVQYNSMEDMLPNIKIHEQVDKWWDEDSADDIIWADSHGAFDGDN